MIEANSDRSLVALLNTCYAICSVLLCSKEETIYLLASSIRVTIY